LTLKGKQNHYNVKFLKGYGHSISVKDSKIVLKDNHDPFSEGTTEEWFVKNMPYEKLVVSGNGYIIFAALKSLAQNNRNVILTDTSGHPICLMNGLMDSLTGTKYCIGQYDTFRDESKRKYLEKQITKTKIQSMLNS